MLKARYRCIQAKPKKIIIFRDGVSEGQFKQVSTFFSFTRNFNFWVWRRNGLLNSNSKIKMTMKKKVLSICRLTDFLNSLLCRWNYLDLVKFILVEILPNAPFQFPQNIRKSKVWCIKEGIVINEFLRWKFWRYIKGTAEGANIEEPI